MELVWFVVIVIAAAVIGIWLGMLAAPRIGRLVERHEEELDAAEPDADRSGDVADADPDAHDDTSGRRDDEGTNDDGPAAPA